MRVATLRAVTALHRAVFDVTRGRVLGSMVGMPVYKVTTRGRRSGEPRDTMLTAPVVDGDRVVLVASYGGHPTHPQWYENMLADPRVVLTGGGRRREVVVRTATPAERAELWPRVEAAYDGYRAYQAKTDREIPLVICE
jgi:deazaflavin-dependent oxidoreductase (nitroreductase family)